MFEFDPIAHLKNAWATIVLAPLEFGAAVIICAVAIWLFARRNYTGQIALLNERLKLRDDQLADVQTKLNAASPADALIKLGELSAKVQALSLGVWDTLSNEQETALKATLARLVPGPVVFEVGEPYARALGHQLATIFDELGWQVDSSRIMGSLDAWIEVSGPPAPTAAVAEALRMAGLDPIKTKAGDAGGKLQILLGEKPF